MNKEWTQLLSLLPTKPGMEIRWRKIEKTPNPLYYLIRKMEDRPRRDGGNLWTHTKAVCEHLVSLPQFCLMEKPVRQELFVAALLLELDKIAHIQYYNTLDPTSEGEARRLLWNEYDLHGNRADMLCRETICTLIKYHSVPFKMREGGMQHFEGILYDPVPELRRISAAGLLLPDFTIRGLSILASAKAEAFRAEKAKKRRRSVELFIEQAQAADCYLRPFSFPDARSRYLFLTFDEDPIYNTIWGEVTIVCGLPSTDKDEWIRQNAHGLPVLSLQEMCKHNRLIRLGDQSLVLTEAELEAKDLLKKQKPFILDVGAAPSRRREIYVKDCEMCNAQVRLVYIESAGDDKLEERGLLRKIFPKRRKVSSPAELVPPYLDEAQTVEWITL